MDSSHPRPPLQAPSASAPAGLDERLVVPETAREEMLDGKRLHAAPAEYQHADPHCRVDYLIAAHARPGYVGASDLLTRVAADSDFASDACIRRDGIDPATGERHLEELAFEVVHRRGRKDNDRRAALMRRRGVRRVIGIFVLRENVCEFDPATGRWHALDRDGVIDDPCLVRPLPVRALLDSAQADAAVIEALEARDAPALRRLKQASARAGQRQGRAEGRREGRKEGRKQGRRQGSAALLARQLERRFGPLPEQLRARLERAGETEIERLADAVLDAASLDEVFGST